MPNEDIDIIDLILADINAVIPNFTSLVSSYRLLVGSAEEFRRTNGVPLEVFQRAVVRSDRAGTLIDILLELLCCKIVYASRFLGTICAPIDLPRYIANDSIADYTPQRTAEQVLVIEAIRLFLASLCEESPCFGEPPPGIGCPQPPPLPCPPVPATPAQPALTNGKQTSQEEPLDADAQDLINEIAPVLLTDLTDTTSLANTNLIPRPKDDPIRTRRHYQRGARISKHAK